MNEKKLKAKDFITVGIFTALLFVVEFACGMLGFIHPYIVASYAVLVPLVGAIPMMLFYSKIEKFGMLTIMSVLLAIIMFVAGMGWLGSPLILLTGLCSDLIAKKGNYKSFRLTALSHGVFSMWVCANYIPVAFTAESYRKSLEEGGYTAEYADNLFRAINSRTIFLLLALCFVFGVIGAFLGRSVVKKHFEKAGIV
ncbi:MAG: MptD family putative ECF transporter S component [Oscillospiraceae bacterium]|nr:MptD family putative ECF transporter S component [Oscillospiraceae bacterium]